MDNHIIQAGYTARGYFKTRPAYQYDYGQVLMLNGFTLTQAFEVHFSKGNGQSITMIGSGDQVDVPDECLTKAGTVTAWLFLHDTESDGETKFVIDIPVKERAEITNQEPTPVQQDTITQAIAALNAGVEAAQDAQEAAEEAADSVKNAGATATTLEPGSPATVVVEDVEGTKTFKFGIPQGEPGQPGAHGQPGQPGQPGNDGVSPTISVTDITGGHRVTITDATGSHSFDVMDGGDATIDDTAGEGDTTKVWSANKSHEENQSLLSAINVLEPAATSGDVGKFLKAKTVADGKVTEYEFGEGGSGGVSDVQVNGVSVVTDGVANVPKASNSAYGVIKTRSSQGITVTNDGELVTVPIDSSGIKVGTQAYQPIVAKRQHESAFYGLAKAAGDSTQSASSNAVGTYTETAKSAIRKMLGIDEWELLYDVTTASETTGLSIDLPNLKELYFWYHIPMLASGSATSGFDFKVSDGITTELIHHVNNGMHTNGQRYLRLWAKKIGPRCFGLSLEDANMNVNMNVAARFLYEKDISGAINNFQLILSNSSAKIPANSEFKLWGVRE